MGIVLGGERHENPKAREIVVQPLDERRYPLAIDGIVRYVGMEEEWQRRLSMLVANDDRAKQDEGLGRLWRIVPLMPERTR